MSQDKRAKSSQRSPLLKRITSFVPSISPRAKRASVEAAHIQSNEAHGNQATKLQAAWRGKQERRRFTLFRTTKRDAAATKVQATWRGRMYRSIFGSTSPSAMQQAKPPSSPDAARFEKQMKRFQENLRITMAAQLYPTRSVQAQRDALLELEAALAKSSPPRVQRGAANAQGGSDMSPVGSSRPSEAMSTLSADEVAQKARELKAVLAIQANFRGRQARKLQLHCYCKDGAQKKAPTQGRPLSPLYVAGLLGCGIGVLYAVVPTGLFAVGIASLRILILLLYPVIYYLAAICLALYTWLRLPFWLGWLGSNLITQLALHGHPLGFESIRVRIWLGYDPLSAYLEVNATNFFMNNPPMGCRDAHLVRAERVHLIAQVDLAFLKQLLKGHSLEHPIVICIKQLILTGVDLNMMFGRTGEFNLAVMGKYLTHNELRSAIGGMLHPHKSLTLPNVLKLRIIAARKLLPALPNLQPRVEVTIRTLKLSTACATQEYGSDGSAVFTFGKDGTEMIFPVQKDMRDAVIIVRVFNDNVSVLRRPALIGQWFMTIKYLIMFPKYCKHSSIVAHGDGHITGTFLLADAKMHGSAMRGVGPSYLGTGLCGELDMDIHYTHTPLLDPPPPRKPRSAIEQLNANGVEDKVKMGNMAELKKFLRGIPIRLDIDFFVMRKIRVEMSDLFTGARTASDADDADDSLKENENPKNYIALRLAAAAIKRVPSFVRKACVGLLGQLLRSETDSQVDDAPIQPSEAAEKAAPRLSASEKSIYIDHINFGRFEQVSLYDFLYEFATQMISRVSVDYRALFSASREIFSGLAENLTSRIKNLNPVRLRASSSR